MLTSTLLPLFSLAAWGRAVPGDLFPFAIPWDDDAPSAANVAAWNEVPAGRHGFVQVRDGHFVDGQGQRLRFLGTNVCFAADFPPPEIAEIAARRMAKFGINIVRFHHEDSGYFPGGLWDPAFPDKQHFSAEALDRYDYFIYQLKLNGIYTNINLHVSRTLGAADGIEQADELPSMNKGVDNFHPRMIELQKKFAKELLTHVNRYTGTRLCDEPAVAMIEINNENSLTSSWQWGQIDALPAYLQDLLDQRWQVWLLKKYGTTEALRAAWAVGAMPLGEEMALNGDFQAGVEPWSLELHPPAQATHQVVPEGPNGAPALRIDVTGTSDTSWHVQVHEQPIPFAAGQPYTLTLWLRADPPREIALNNFTTREPWHPLGLTANVRATREWQPFTFQFRASKDYPAARLGLSGLASQAGTVWLAQVSLRPGGVQGLLAGESLEGRLTRPRRNGLGGRTEACQRDYYEFLLALEAEYWTGMANFLREECEVKCPITGTQMGYTPPQTHAAMDYYDGHAYWHHPWFPARPWDSSNWWVTNQSMVDSAGGVLPGLAAQRVRGAPYTVSEFNNAAPNTYAAEGLLLLGAYGALQDWDGIFNFAWNHSDQWQVHQIPNFFDIKSHPVKLVTLPAVAALFRRGDVSPAREELFAVADAAAVLDQAIATGNPAAGGDATRFGIPAPAALTHRLSVVPEKPASAPKPPAYAVPGEPLFISDTGQLRWDRRDREHQHVVINTPRSKAVIGFCDGQEFDLDSLRIRMGPTRQGWSALTLTAMTGDGLDRPGRLLLTATGYAENPGWAWETEGDRVTVRNRWGGEPSRCEGIPAQIDFLKSTQVEAWALDERSQRKAKVPVKIINGVARLEIGPEFETLWYEVEVGG